MDTVRLAGDGANWRAEHRLIGNLQVEQQSVQKAGREEGDIRKKTRRIREKKE